MFLTHLKVIIFLTLTMCFSVSCGLFQSSQKALPTLQLEVSASANINAAPSEQGTPLQVRLYELSSTALFNNADFLDLYLHDATTLQSTLIQKHLLPTIFPSEQKTLHVKLSPETHFIAILAEFANYRTAVSTAYLALASDKHHTMSLFLRNSYVRLVLIPPST